MGIMITSKLEGQKDRYTKREIDRQTDGHSDNK